MSPMDFEHQTGIERTIASLLAANSPRQITRQAKPWHRRPRQVRRSRQRLRIPGSCRMTYPGSATPWLRHAHIRCWRRSWDEAIYPGQFVAHPLTNGPTIYVLLADTLEELHAQLPPGMMWSDRQPADLSEVVEIWFRPALAPSTAQ
jgi:hypothetical protein